MNRVSLFGRVIAFTALIGFPAASFSFTLSMTGEHADAGSPAVASNCSLYEENAFTGAAGNTVFTSDESYSHGTGLQLSVEEGSQGFGTLGGIIDFSRCESSGGRYLTEGDEIWIRARFLFPEGFEFNEIGRNKFMRLRTFQDVDGSARHEGYNDLYIDGQERRRNPARFHFIFEGENRWKSFGGPDDFFSFGEWTTIEYYVRLGEKPFDEGGNAKVMMWLDGELLGEATDGITLRSSNSYVQSLYFFTWWGNEGAHKSQHFYVDDLVITTDTPADRDAFGNPFIGTKGGGAEKARPLPPVPLN